MSIADVHCHIVYGVDDGSKSLEESLDMLKMEYESGVRTIILTPHHHKGRMDKPVDVLKERYETLKANNKYDIDLYLGSELFSESNLVDELNEGLALTMNNTKYVLVEFYPSTPYKEIEAQFRSLLMSGYKPIIAHIERYDCFLKDPYLVEDLSDLGIKIQINATSLNNFTAKRFIKKLLKYELVDLIGSDAHNTTSRSPNMSKYIEYIRKKTSEDYFDKITSINAIKMINGEDF